MHIEITYMPNDLGESGVEIHDIPADHALAVDSTIAWGNARVDGRPGYGLVLRQTVRGCWDDAPTGTRVLIGQPGMDQQSFAAWRIDMVASVIVDNRTIWANPALDNEGGDVVEGDEEEELEDEASSSMGSIDDVVGSSRDQHGLRYSDWI